LAPWLASSGASSGCRTQRPTPIRVASAPCASSSSALHPGRAQRGHEYHPLERCPGDAHRKVKRMVRTDAAIQQQPHGLGAAGQGSGLHDRRRIRRKQQIGRLRQRGAEPGDITATRKVPRPRHAAGAHTAPGNWVRTAGFLSGGPCRGHLRADQGHGEGTDLRVDRRSVALGRDSGLDRLAEMAQPPVRELGRDRQPVVLPTTG